MKKKTAKDCLEFFVIVIILSVTIDYFLDKTLDSRYFLDLLGKSIFMAVSFGLLLPLFKKQFQKEGGKD